MQNYAEAITITMPDDARTCLATLQSLSRSCRQIMQIKLTAIGIEVGQDQFLDALTIKESITVSDLARKLNVRPSTTSKMADRLVAHGWIVREIDEEDARRTPMRLTPSGHEAQALVRDVWARLEDDLTTALGEQSQNENAISALERIAAVLSVRLSRLR